MKDALKLALDAIEQGATFDHLEDVVAPALRTAIDAAEKQEPARPCNPAEDGVCEAVECDCTTPPAAQQEPGEGKDYSERLKRLAFLAIAYQAGGVVNEKFPSVSELYALIDEVCTGLDSPPSPPVAPVQEPVGEVCGYYERGFDAEKTRYGKLYDQDLPLGIKLYTTPPAAQRQWVGLTQQEVQEIHDTYHKRMGHQEFAVMLEQRLKEKNNGKG